MFAVAVGLIILRITVSGINRKDGYMNKSAIVTTRRAALTVRSTSIENSDSPIGT